MDALKVSSIQNELGIKCLKNSPFSIRIMHDSKLTHIVFMCELKLWGYQGDYLTLRSFIDVKVMIFMMLKIRL